MNYLFVLYSIKVRNSFSYCWSVGTRTKHETPLEWFLLRIHEQGHFSFEYILVVFCRNNGLSSCCFLYLYCLKWVAVKAVCTVHLYQLDLKTVYSLSSNWCFHVGTVSIHKVFEVHDMIVFYWYSYIFLQEKLKYTSGMEHTLA